jgi:hypothetical protein
MQVIVRGAQYDHRAAYDPPLFGTRILTWATHGHTVAVCAGLPATAAQLCEDRILGKPAPSAETR